jgi:glyoxylase-like metal-dependent hydrolase (beta-lactamase superfamily II)
MRVPALAILLGLCGSPSVVLLSTPGHTPGHQSL